MRRSIRIFSLALMLVMAFMSLNLTCFASSGSYDMDELYRLIDYYFSNYYNGEGGYNNSEPQSITECIRKGALQAYASSWFRGNNPKVDPSKMLDGDIRTSWDSDNERFPDFWFETTDGKEYTVKGFRIVNGKTDDYYYRRNDRICEVDVYVDGRFVEEIRLSDECGVYQTVYLTRPVTGSQFFFHVNRVYETKHETRRDLCVSEIEFF